MKRPNFFIVGAPKCGTSAWYTYLSNHPDICFSKAKEPHYFCTDFPNFRWAKTEEEYLAYFNECAGERIVGDASVQYLFSTEAAANIAAFAPRAKILIFVRQPGAFLKSYHNQLLLNLDEEITDFSSAWRLSIDPGSRQIPLNCREPRHLDYRAVGRFSEQIERYMASFPASQIKLVDFEEWTCNPRSTYLDILTFLDVDDDGREDFPAVNEAKSVASKSVARFTQRPPGWVLALAQLLRQVAGRERLGVAGLLQRANFREGYRSSETTQLMSEIEVYFYQDQRRLDQLRAKLRDTGTNRKI